MACPAAPAEPGVLGSLGARRGAGTGMKRIAFLIVIAAALFAPAAASAHPLGNFTINRFSRLEVSGHRLYVRYVLDMAEIPTFQARHIDPHPYPRPLPPNTHLDATR